MDIVTINQVENYNVEKIYQCLGNDYFGCIKPGNKVVLKPNWVRQSHQYKPDDWEYVITHPAIIEATIRKVLKFLNGNGEIILIDGPETSSSFLKIISRYPIDVWKKTIEEQNVIFNIIDLREDEWSVVKNVIVTRNKLKGDPLGKIVINLKEKSEFIDHKKSSKGYYGADYNIFETNVAHNGIDNLYSISRTVLTADVFINLPKLKTHKKAGITSCLKNLVGVNTYKNYLPHYSIGNKDDNGDQFSFKSAKNSIEASMFSFIKQNILIRPYLAKIFSPFFNLGNKIFGETSSKVRSGNWYGNDTIWRMILDLNKIVLYSNSHGIMREDKFDNRKNYIGIVDGIFCGEGNGPKAPDRKNHGLIVCGTNPVSIDAVCALSMGYDPFKIPVIANAFKIKKYKLTDTDYDDIQVKFNNELLSISHFPKGLIHHFESHFGWKGHIENPI
jgi:uncharacterized protein (DUF362 family)